MLISAITQLTLLDYPGKMACIIFTAGCNFRCGFCHNPEFVLPEEIEKLKDNFIPFEAVLNFLKTRKGLIDGVVICGGEPTIQVDLIERIKDIKELGFLVKLDTNGTRPEVVEELLRLDLIDFIAMDIKSKLVSPLVSWSVGQENKFKGEREKVKGESSTKRNTLANSRLYSEITNTQVNIENILRSIDLIMNSGVDYEFRTTILPKFHSIEILKQIAEELKGAKLWALQRFQNRKTLKKKFSKYQEYSKNDLECLKNEIEKLNLIEKIIVRY